jgi:hypothetical protein
MKIAIIGGGWVGCHLALNLKNDHDVVIFDKNDELFSETSYKNQNRLHYGFHYSRNDKTRQMCKNTFNLFLNQYGDFTETIEKNYYCVPNKKSLLDFNTYKKIFSDFNFQNVDFNILNSEGCINTNEKYINFKKLKAYFNENLKNIFIKEEITYNKLKKISSKYDLVINSTNNFIKDKNNKDFYYELTLTLLYNKIKNTDFDSLTLVDGNFFSIYPYSNNSYTVTDVEYTPLIKTKSNKKLSKFIKKIDDEFINDKIKLFEKKILHYLPKFYDNFKYDDYFLSIKTKFNDNTDNRYPVISKNNNIINCFTGKIQGIFIIEDYITNIINETFNR